MAEGPITVRAWDDERPPELSLIDDCVHCGFCLPTCPTYALWGEEMDSPRGRIVLMRAGHDEGSSVSEAIVGHIDNCLGCMACVTACPSGVQYDKLIEDTRGQIERNWRRGPAERAFRRLLFALFPHPRRLRVLAPLLAVARALRLDRAAARLLPSPHLRALATMLPPPPRRIAPAERTPPNGESRGRVALLQGCVQRVFFGDVNAATARVLGAEGFEVLAPSAPRCCGALELHAGEADAARALARTTIEALEDFDYVAVNAAGCGSAMKDYGHALRDDPRWAERAAAFSDKVRDVSELLAGDGARAQRRPLAMRVAYHDACHLAHGQGIREPPRELLRSIPELELLEPREWEICCGSAGVYNLLKPEPAAELGRRKAENLLATGADAIAAANPGCAIQIQAHTRSLGQELPVFHPVELLERSIAPR